MSAAPCPFCFPDETRVFHSGELVLGLWDRYPVAAGHALLIPRRHVASWFDATPQERAELTEAVEVVQQAVRQHHSPDGFNIGVNVGNAAGQTVSHLHVHIIPRYDGDVPDPRGGVRHIIPGKAAYPTGGAGREIVADAPASYQSQRRAQPSDEADEGVDAATDRSVVAFGERMLQLLDESRRVATYKYAVLLALTDLCLEQASAMGDPPVAVTTHELAEKVLELYWPHTAAFDGKGGMTVLRQNTGGQAEILSAIGNFREHYAADPSEPLSRARHRAPDQYERLVRTVEWKLIEMPLPKLQRLGNAEPFPLSNRLGRLGEETRHGNAKLRPPHPTTAWCRRAPDPTRRTIAAPDPAWMERHGGTAQSGGNQRSALARVPVRSTADFPGSSPRGFAGTAEQ
jgi:diadenosine tetraphosphate (Ap4A) HIT family hydrolase